MKSMFKTRFVAAIVFLTGVSAWASPATDDLIKMARSGVDEEVLSAYIQSSPDTYDLTADEIITLKDLGVSSKTIKQAMQHGQADTASPVAPVVQEAAGAGCRRNGGMRCSGERRGLEIRTGLRTATSSIAARQSMLFRGP